MKTCSKCLQIKELSQFDNQRSQCKSCRLEYKKTLPKLDNDVLVTEQKCSCCKVTKPAINFHPERTRVTGLYPYCKPCALVKQQEKYQRNANKYRVKSSENYQKTKNTDSHKISRRSYMKHKLDTDIFFKLKRNLRNRLYYALLNTDWKKGTHFTEYIGCDRDTLVKHLESQFKEGMNWDNYTHDGWHIDHIIPLDSAISELDLYKLCHYTNLQPMWATDNIKKGNKIG